jgi:TrmH family RNA methyltransferase
MLTRISSRQNPVVARFRAVAQGDRQTMLLDGPHLVTDALAARVPIEVAVVAHEALERRDELGQLVSRLESAGIEVVVGTPPVMAAVSPVRSPSRIVALAPRPATSAGRLFVAGPHTPPGGVPIGGLSLSRPLVLVACDVQEPGNLGAMVRVAEAAGATGFIAAGESADPFGWKALRGSMGSALRIPILAQPSSEALLTVRAHHCTVVAAVPRDGRSLEGTDLTGPTALLIGGEGGGLSQEIIDLSEDRVSISMEPPVESLNAAVAAAVILYEARRQRHGLALS